MLYKHYLVISVLMIGSALSHAQSNQLPKLEKIIYHSTSCFGSCPKVDLVLDSNRNFYVSRQFYKGKASPVKENSGAFTGTVTPAEYQQLLSVLKKADYSNLIFPDITCCDGPVKTIIIYADGKRKYLKSMTPPAEANALINWLMDLGVRKSLQKATEDRSIEE